MKILITGGAGFVGSHLADKLISLHHEVIIVDDLSSGKKEFVNCSAKFYKTDIRSNKLSKIFQKHKPDIVYHIAAQKSVPKSLEDPSYDAQINILGGLNVLENCAKYNIKKIIFTSTGGAIYDEADKFPTDEECEARPLSPYAIAKFSMEKYIQFYSKVKNLNYTIVRPANIYGPRQDPFGEAGVIAIFINNLINNKKCFINGGEQTRDFVYVADVVNALIKSLDGNNQIYNIATENDISIKELYKKIKNNVGSQLEAEMRDAIKGEVFKSQLSNQQIKQDLNWSPEYNLEKGIKETIEYFNNANK